MSVEPVRPDRAADTVAGFMATAAVFVSMIGVAYRPVRLIPASVIVALVAAAIGGRHVRLAYFALAVCGLCWVLGMTVAVLTENPLY